MGADIKRVALVTGASGGIGREIAGLLAARGWTVVLVGRSADRLEAVAAGIAAAGGPEAVAVPADLSRPGAAEALLRACQERGLEVEMLVNNAGRGLFGEAVDLPTADVEAMLYLNMSSLTTLCAVFGREMKLRRKGIILNVGSFAGNQATPYFAAYAASKSYVLAYSLALRAELMPHGVSVTCLQPGYVRTGFDENAGIQSKPYLEFSTKNGMSALDVARIGVDAALSEKSHTIAGLRNQFAAGFLGLLPKSAPPWLMKSVLDRLMAP